MRACRIALISAIFCLLHLPFAHSQTVTFDFDTGTPQAFAGEGTPLSQTAGGITANFSSPSDGLPGPAYSVQNAGTTFWSLSQFSGNYLVPSTVYKATLKIQFSRPITSITLKFATADFQQVEVPSPLQVTAYNGTTVVGSATAQGTYAGDTMPMGTLTFVSSGQSFNSVELLLPYYQNGASDFLVDNIVVTPAPMNPVPSISAWSPVSVAPGGPDMTLIVRGTGFINGTSAIYWNGAPLANATTCTPATPPAQASCTVTVPAGNVAIPGTARVTVVNPNPTPSPAASNAVFLPIVTARSSVTTSKTNFAVGGQPNSAVVGDFNNDGNLDVATADLASNSVSILLGDGLGGLNPAISPTTDNGPIALAVGDFNSDGNLDLAVGNYYSANVNILLGDGAGGFTPAIGFSPAAGTNPMSVVTGDFNGDGRLDLAVANNGSNTVTILLGDGSGTFTPGASPATGTAPVALALGDFNGDGILDLAVANNGSNNLTILLGDGAGGFAAAASSPSTGVQPSAIEAADFNGDGKLDLAVVNNCGADVACGSNGSLSILFGDGTGGFTPAAASITVGGDPRSVAAGDLNGDGILDLAVVNACGATRAACGTSSVSILLDDGAGGFTADSIPATGNGSNSVALGDLNGDGQLDLVASNQTDNTLSVMLQGATAVPIAAVAPASLQFSPQLVGSTTTAQTVTLSNTGAAALSISSIATTGDFAQTNNCGSSVAATGSCSLDVTFTPTASGSRAGTLTITDDSNGIAGTTQVITLTGTGIAPVVSLSSASLTFAGQVSGTTSSPQSVTLTNSGTATLTLNSIAVSGANAPDFAETNNCGTSVVVNSTCAINVTFTPAAGGARTATITITNNHNGISNSTQTVTLSGTGQDFTVGAASGSSTTQAVTAGQTANYHLEFTPQGASGNLALTCAGAPVGATCTISPASFTLSGTSASNATVTVTTTGSAMTSLRGPQKFTPPVGTPRQLDAGRHMNLSLVVALLALLTVAASLRLAPRFAGLKAGAKWLGAVMAVPHRRTSPVWALAGALLAVVVWAACGGGGTTPHLPLAGAKLSASSLTFSSQNLGSSSAAQSVTLTNSGTAWLAVSSIALGGSNSGDFVQNNNCHGAVAPGANCQINVRFLPTATGERSGSVTITHNASGSPQSITLSGTGVRPPTPTGTYTLTVTGTLAASSGTLTHTLPLTLTVN